MRKKMIFIVPAAIAGVTLFCFIGGEVVMRLWNWLAPSLFGWHTVTFWQAFGLLALCRILFGGHGWGGRGHSKFRHRMKARCNRMTPEERERFRQAMRERWAFSSSASASKA